MSKISLFHYLNTFYSWCDENFEKNKPSVASVYFSALHIANRLKWPEVFGLPRDHVMHLMGLSSRSQYYDAFKILEEEGFFIVIEKSKNQNKATVIKLSLPTAYTSDSTCKLTTEYSSESTIDKTNKNFITIKKDKDKLLDIFQQNGDLKDFLVHAKIDAERKIREFIAEKFSTGENLKWQDETAFFTHFRNWCLKANTIKNEGKVLEKAERRWKR